MFLRKNKKEGIIINIKYYLTACFCFTSIMFSQVEYEPGVLLVRVKEPERVVIKNKVAVNGNIGLNNILQNNELRYSKKLPHSHRKTDGWYRLEFPVKKNVKQIKDLLINNSDIEDVNLNYYGKLSGTPNDPYWDGQWALKLIGMPSAWGLIQPDSSILMGIIDSGINDDHEDFEGNIWVNPNDPLGGGDDDANGYVDDINGWNFTYTR
ncbi:MAG: hypothetical protein ISR82_08735, partial [Candidatus Marinimicrobia bacterium]|nr:hypothetical protein [Candidatus Neomarinimicrobiota bacterium]